MDANALQPIRIGDLLVGAGQPIRLQTMTTTPTLDVEATVQQCLVLAKAGAELIRITAQNVNEAEALKKIKAALRAQNLSVPLVADVHFNAEVAIIAAQYVEKVRINPGNFVSEKELQDNPALLQEKFFALLQVCQQHGTALRIGVNHGSLSERIMQQYGDTPQGMVASAMEFLQLCHKANFENVVVSMKASNTRVMVYATRLLALAMEAVHLCYPLHLGVTEAGEGEDARIKSAVGIGTLLAEGLGDTIRVSLTEPPEHELPVAAKLVDYIAEQYDQEEDVVQALVPVTSYVKRSTTASPAVPVGATNAVNVWADLSALSPIYQHDIEQLGFTFNGKKWQGNEATPDAIYIGSSLLECPADGLCVIDDENENILRCRVDYLSEDFFAFLKQHPEHILLLEHSSIYTTRLFFQVLQRQQLSNPVIMLRSYKDADKESFQLKAAVDCGALLLDGYGDGIMLNALLPTSDVVQTAFGILQAARVRFTKTEYIACPGCGRTLYDIQKTLKDIKAKTAHYKGLKIAVMGCIVNGPGEMADADYGYVGAGAGKVSLYKGKECVQKNIPQAKAVEALITLINQR
ncbi:4-hydroxy-3-methylbut-2-en-1-yl diphosphate synthase (flavodoxin) [Bacteroidia bacterium]|nr:4-hydroxy-3-methylbut-2-en-1-yl diphosphate synthase (flavodoxin) [Bacteroidia bacterium]